MLGCFLKIFDEVVDSVFGLCIVKSAALQRALQAAATNFTGHPSPTLRAGFVEVSEARSDWAPDPEHPLPKFDPPRRVPHGVTILGRLFDDGLLGRVGIALEREFGVASERPAGFEQDGFPGLTTSRKWPRLAGMNGTKKTDAVGVTMVGVADLKGPRTGHLVIHFNGVEWRKATAGLKRVQHDATTDELPGRGVAFVPVGPERPDLGTLVLPDPCGNGCVKKTWPREDGLGRCDCGKPNVPTPGPGDAGAPQNTRGCKVVLVGGKFKCIGIGCGRNCKPELHLFNLASRLMFGVVVCHCT